MGDGDFRLLASAVLVMQSNAWGRESDTCVRHRSFDIPPTLTFNLNQRAPQDINRHCQLPAPPSPPKYAAAYIPVLAIRFLRRTNIELSDFGKT
jgi:hypothetical protein